MKKIIIPILCAILLSCAKHAKPEPEIVTESPDPDIVEERYDMYLYHIQSDVHLLLHSLIRYDDAPGKFFLDLSCEDAALLGFSKDAYNQAVRMADKINKEHLP